ncbi:MAG: chromosomal replication initiator protein DnaA [Holosporales bacterium]|jgi:chromosomal replication initiator protein|nr:chromosomal replication initiator protein DnaA [Holosporales bacterium]
MSDVSDVKLKQIWAEALLDIKAAVGDGAFKTWISKLDIAGIDDIVLKLIAPSNFIRDNVLSRFSNDIIKIMNSYGCQIRTISVDVYDKGAATISSISDNDTEKIGIKEYQDISVLDKRFTFKNFVIGKPNEFAYAAALRISESEVPTFNPLFLYGGVGLGKTHLMHAIAWNTHHHFPRKKVIYLSAEKFMYLFIKSLRFKNAISFKEMFRTVDALMIDDVQFIGGKDTTQEEFFHTFNELVDNNKQVILSADKSPSDLGGVEDRLKSRLGWGLVADIHPTTYELRLGILQSKTKQFKATVPDNVLEFLAGKITSNIRELEGALNRIIAHSTLVGRRITLEVAQEVLKDILRTNEKLITIDFIQRKVCEYYGVKLSDLTSARRHKAVTTARQIAMYLCKDLTSRSLPDIGKNFGGKDHSTVIHAIKKIKDLMANDNAFNADLEILKKSLQN